VDHQQKQQYLWNLELAKPFGLQGMLHLPLLYLTLGLPLNWSSFAQQQTTDNRQQRALVSPKVSSRKTIESKQEIKVSFFNKHTHTHTHTQTSKLVGPLIIQKGRFFGGRTNQPFRL